MNENKLRDRRYDLALHLVTAAKLGPEIYNLGNKARYETCEEACALDDITQ